MEENRSCRVYELDSARVRGVERGRSRSGEGFVEGFFEGTGFGVEEGPGLRESCMEIS